MYSTGKLCKVAITSGAFTYEDSSRIIDQLSKDLATDITMKKEISLGTNANITSIVKKGDQVKTGDNLLVYENSFEDSSLNSLLDKLGKDFNETISDMSKNIITSKYTGRIVDVKMYYNRDIEESSPSIQKILKNYIKEANKKNKLFANSSYIDNQIIPVEKIHEKKIKGTEVDGILIEIYIEYHDEMSIGEKILKIVA